MNIEELKEFMQDESNKSQLADIFKTLGFKSADEIKGLEDKKNELLGLLRKEKDKRIEIEKRFDNIDIDSYNEYISSLEKKPDKKLDNELAKLKKELENKDVTLQQINFDFNKELKKTSLSEIFDKIGIDPQYKKILTSAFLGKALVEIDNIDGKETRNVMFEDEGGLRLPTQEFFQKWVESDEGKTYLKKPDNKGGHSSSFSSEAQSKMKRSEFELKSATEKMSLIDQGIIIID